MKARKLKATTLLCCNLLLCCFLALAIPNNLFAQTGTVFHDFNANGVMDAGEPGVKGVIVRSYNTANNLLATVTSNGNGNYSLIPSAITGQKVRVEFEIPAALNFFHASPAGSVYGSQVQFITGNASNINFAVLNSSRYTQGNPFHVVPAHIKGDAINGLYKDENTIFTINHAWGTSGNLPKTLSAWRVPSAPVAIAQAKEVGTIYGLGWSKTRNTVYAGAFYRQFSGFGPNGPGAIYQIPVNPATGLRTAAPSLFVDVSTLPGVSVMADIHGSDLTTQTHSDTRLAATTKCSLGDIEISDDENKLYTVNLTSREVLSISLNNGTLLGKWMIPTTGLTTLAGTANPNDIRPFGLGYKDGKLYVGAVCTGESTQIHNNTYAGVAGNKNAMHGYVWTLDESTGVFTLVFNFSFNAFSDRWFAWQQSWANGVRVILPSSSEDYPIVPQPIISDIEFYGNDIMVAIRDRQGDLWGFQIMDPVLGILANGNSEGDLIGGAYNEATGTYSIENNGIIGSRVATGVNGTYDGDSEFYRGDGGITLGIHRENMIGGLSQYGAYPLVFSAMTPAAMYNVGYYNNAGLSWLSNQTGASMRGYVLYESAEGEPDVPTLAKANGLGDVEVLGGMGPMEIGNRVWEDSDADGVQDADEQPLSGVIVELYDAAGTNLLGTTTTNATGNWYFTAQRNSNYRVRIAATQFNNRQGIGTLAGYYLTLPNRGSTVNQDYSDSDAGHTAAGLAEINITTGDYGSTNHHLDIGLTRNLVVLATATVELTVQPGAGKWQLNWTAAAGHNYTRFIAERSADGRVFSSLGEKTAVSSNQYQLADNKQTGIQYYRIKAVSSTGDAVYSNVVSVNNSNSKEIKIYPNPAINTLQVTLPSELYGKSVSLELLNSSGQLVLLKKSRMFSVSEQLDVLELSRGVYYLRVVADNTVYKVQKIELVR